MSASRWARSPGVILGSLTTLNALNYVDRYVAAATLPLILADLAISDAQGGLLQSLFIVAYSLACGPAGWLGDVGKRLRLVAGGVFVWSVATVASGLAPTYAMLLLARAVVGVGEASYAVVTPSLLSDCYPAERRARVLGIFCAAIPVGSALGYVVGGLVGEHFGWRAAFFVAGAPGMVLAFVLLLLAEPRRGAYDAGGVGAVTPLSLRASPSLTLLLLFMNIGPLNAAMANVLPADLRARGVAVTTGVMHLLGDAASPWLIGVASDAVGLTLPVLVTGALLVVAGVVLLLDRASLVRDTRAVAASGDAPAAAGRHG